MEFSSPLNVTSDGRMSLNLWVEEKIGLNGTSILIVVVVAMDTVTQVQTRLMSSQYESLIKKTKFGK